MSTPGGPQTPTVSDAGRGAGPQTGAGTDVDAESALFDQLTEAEPDDEPHIHRGLE